MDCSWSVGVTGISYGYAIIGDSKELRKAAEKTVKMLVRCTLIDVDWPPPSIGRI